MIEKLHLGVEAGAASPDDFIEVLSSANLLKLGPVPFLPLPVDG